MMENILRVCNSGRLRPTDLIKKYQGGVSWNIANEFWTLTVNEAKKISLTLKNAAGAVVASTLVKYSIFEYSEGNPYNYLWMTPISKGVVTTTADGGFEVLYTGSEGVGGTAYVAIIHPNTTPTESMVWPVTVS